MIYTLGESLLDIIFKNTNNLLARPGGGMLNTAVSLGRSGVDVSLISELGDDETAKMIVDFLKNNGVGTKYVKKYYHQHTSVALAFLNEQKVPSFSIYKTYPEKRRLIFPSEITEADILVYGSLYSLDPAIRNDIVEIIVSAKQGGALLCYDPNIRQHNLDDPEIRMAFKENVSFANIIKGSDEDFNNIFGPLSEDDYFSEILKINPEALFIFTKGPEGVIGFYKDSRIDLPAIETNVVSTIGAGDAFNAGMVYYLNKIKDKSRKSKRSEDPDLSGIKDLDADGFRKMLEAGLGFSSEVCGSVDNYISKPPAY